MAAAFSHLSDLEKVLDELGRNFLSCAICLELFKKPKVLPCDHSFCESCLTKLVKGRGRLKCPTCRMVCNLPDGGVPKLKANFFINSLADLYLKQRPSEGDNWPPVCGGCAEHDGANWCVDCSVMLCKICTKSHKQFVSGHKIMTLDDYKTAKSSTLLQQQKVYCNVHPENVVKFFCETCGEVVCTDCAITKHNKHTHTDLQDAAKEHSRMLQDLVRKAVETKKGVAACKSVAIQIREKLVSGCREEEQKVRRQTAEIIQKAQREERRLIAELQADYGQRVKQAEGQIDEWELKHGQIASQCCYVETLLHHGTPAQIMSTKQETIHHMEKIISMETKVDARAEMLQKFQAKHYTENGMLGSLIRDSSSVHKEKGLVKTIGCKGGRAGEFNCPLGVSINRHGDIVTADINNNRIQTTTRDGNYKSSFTFTQFANPFLPQDVAISVDDEYLMTDRVNKQIVVSDENGSLIRCFGKEVKYTHRIAISPVDGSVYVSDWDGKGDDTDKDTHCIRKYTRDFRYMKSFGCYGTKQGEFMGPYFLTVDNSGVVFASDIGNNRIQAFNADGEFLFAFGSFGEGDGKLHYPTGIVADNAGCLYVCDMKNNKVQKFDNRGKFICRIDKAEDGLNSPAGITVTDDMEVVVADWGNHCLKVFAQ